MNRSRSDSTQMGTAVEDRSPENSLQTDVWKIHINRLLLGLAMQHHGLTRSQMAPMLKARDDMAAKLDGKRFKDYRELNERIIKRLTAAYHEGCATGMDSEGAPGPAQPSERAIPGHRGDSPRAEAEDSVVA